MVFLLETDTIWGISANAYDCNEVKRVFDLKRRPYNKNKSMIILISGFEQFKSLTNFNIDPDSLSVFNGATLIVPVRSKTQLCDKLIRNGTIAVRIPNSLFIRKLIWELGYPIISTSANLHGGVSPKYFDEIPTQIKDSVDVVIPNPDKNYKGLGLPSTILDLINCRVVREGLNSDHYYKKLKELCID